MTCSKNNGHQGSFWNMLLFVAGEGPNSVTARQNLSQICEKQLKGQYDLKIIDVLEDFRTALACGILVTPALVITEPYPPVTVLGDLSDTEKLLKALRLKN